MGSAKRFIALILVSYIAFPLGANAVQSPVFFRTEIPLELKAVNRFESRVSRFEEKLQFAELSFRDVGQGHLKLALPEARMVSLSGMPEVPTILKTLNLNRSNPIEVDLVNMVVEESSTAVSLKKAEDAYLWAPDHRLAFFPQTTQRYFPGKWIESRRHRGRIFINLFPVQVDLHTGKLLRLISADLKVTDADSEFISMPTLNVAELLAKPSLIVTTQKLKAAAVELAIYHETQLGIKTDIVTSEDIAASENPISEDDLPSGYKTAEGRDDAVKPYDATKKEGYQYELARKIDSYLQKRFTDTTPLRYITILGDADAIPPSYYFAYKSPFGFTYSPTDACYGAVKKCSEPKAAVGRLPFSSAEEVKTYIAKIQQWRAFADNSDSELSLFGGKAFPRSDVYVGELGNLQTIQSDKADWRGVKKYFRTKQTYDRSALLNLVTGKGDSPFAYYLDHGNGNQWYAEEAMLSSKDIAQAVAFEKAHPSLVVSIACTNAAFDETITRETILAPTEKYGSVSVGVALVRSPVGAVAYLGSNRVALGTPSYEFDGFGNLKVTGTNYGLQLLEGFYNQYGLIRRGRLGDYSLKALQAYSFEYGNDMTKDQNAWSYFITELLGDPVIPLPTRKTVESNFEIARSTFSLDNSVGVGLPLLRLKDQKEIALTFDSVNPIQATLLRVLRNEFGGYQGETVVTTKAFTGGQGQAQSQTIPLTVSSDLNEGAYFLRLENTTGVPRERQVHFSVQK